jgi:hypothetical protein
MMLGLRGPGPRELALRTFEDQTRAHDAKIGRQLERLALVRQRAADLRTAYVAAETDAGRVEAEVSDLRREADRDRDAFERVMREHVDPQIDAFLGWIDATHTGLAHQRREAEGIGPLNPATGYRPTVRWSNGEAIILVANALHAARLAAQSLIYERVEDLPGALERIRATVPTVEEAEQQAAARGAADTR